MAGCSGDLLRWLVDDRASHCGLVPFGQISVLRNPTSAVFVCTPTKVGERAVALVDRVEGVLVVDACSTLDALYVILEAGCWAHALRG